MTLTELTAKIKLVDLAYFCAYRTANFLLLEATFSQLFIYQKDWEISVYIQWCALREIESEHNAWYHFDTVRISSLRWIRRCNSHLDPSTFCRTGFCKSRISENLFTSTSSLHHHNMICIVSRRHISHNASQWELRIRCLVWWNKRETLVTLVQTFVGFAASYATSKSS